MFQVLLRFRGFDLLFYLRFILFSVLRTILLPKHCLLLNTRDVLR
jgi:hypothetical protein